MYRDKERYGKDPKQVIRTNPSTFYKALKWKEPVRVFTNSWSDFFIEDADQWRADAWDVIRKTPHITWQILTKRPERIEKCLPEDWGDGWKNVWLGVSIESQKYMDRAYTLSEVPAAVRFISFEPLIDRIDLELDKRVLRMFGWAIIGGESGNDKGKYRYRECDMEWIRTIISGLRGAGVPVFVKQLGTFLAKQLDTHDRHGGELTEWPNDLKIREFPSNENMSEKVAEGNDTKAI
jgi:protein gp37